MYYVHCMADNVVMGNELAHVMNHYGLKLREVVELTGYKPRTVSKWKAGGKIPPSAWILITQRWPMPEKLSLTTTRPAKG